MNPWREQTLKDRNCHGKQTLQRRALRGAHRLPDRAVCLAALPVAVWLDLTNLAEAALRRQASDLNSVISSVRSYYASNVVGRVLAHPGDNPGRPQLRDHSRRDPDPRDACRWNSARSSASSSRISPTASFPTFRSRTARRTSSIAFEKARAAEPARKSRTRRSSRPQARCSPTASGWSRPSSMGASLRQLPQQPPGKPQARLEGRRRPRHSGSHRSRSRSPPTCSRSNICWPISRWPRSAASPSSSCSAARPSRSRA